MNRKPSQLKTSAIIDYEPQYNVNSTKNGNGGSRAVTKAVSEVRRADIFSQKTNSRSAFSKSPMPMPQSRIQHNLNPYLGKLAQPRSINASI